MGFQFSHILWHKGGVYRLRTKTWTVFVRSNTKVVGSSPNPGMDICVFILSFMLFYV
jgi:hypothetical protein